MRTRTILGGLAGLAAFVGGPAQAALIDPFEIAFNVDGDTTPAGVVETTDAQRLGSFAVTLTSAGPHFVLGFFDYEIDEPTNTFFNELGAATGVGAAGQSFEIDEPGFGPVPGDIYDNFLANTLDGLVLAGPEDISMAMAWNFILGAGETALVTFFTDDVLPAIAGLYLTQIDPRSEASIFLWSTLSITGGEPPPPPPTGIPEPTTLALLAAGLLSFGLRRRR